MTLNKKILTVRIIGAGLYGCLLASQLEMKFRKKIKIDIIENTENIISNYNSIKLSKIKLNNGFHGIEYPRAKNLINFIENKLNLKLVKSDNIRYLGINEYLINYLDKKKLWPKELRKYFLKKNLNHIDRKNWKDFIDIKYITFLKKIGKRYSDSFDDIAHNFVPWFFPSEYKIKSNDEGENFRDLVRDKKVKAFFYFPKSGIFEDIQVKFKKYLDKKKIKVYFNSSLKFHEDGYSITTKDNKVLDLPKADYTFFTASSPILLKNFNQNGFINLLKNKKLFVNKLIEIKNTNNMTNFTEVIFANEKLPNLLRISSLEHILKNKKIKYFQVELIINNSDDISNYDNILIEIISSLFKTKIENIKIKDSKISRTLFYPKESDKKNAILSIKKEIQKLKNFHHNYIFGPPNMNKAWINSSTDVQNLWYLFNNND